VNVTFPEFVTFTFFYNKARLNIRYATIAKKPCNRIAKQLIHGVCDYKLNQSLVVQLKLSEKFR